MVDGAASLMTLFYGLFAGRMWRDRRGSNLLDGAAPFYRPYRTKDGEYVFVGAIEPRFFAELLSLAGVDGIEPADQFEHVRWAEQVGILEAVFATRTRDEWAATFDGTDACVTPVLSLAEAPAHAHNRARQTFVEVDGVMQPAPAPRFSRTPSEIRGVRQCREIDAREWLSDWGLQDDDVDQG